MEKGYESALDFYSYIEDEHRERRKRRKNEPIDEKRVYSVGDLTSSHDYSEGRVGFRYHGSTYHPGRRFWTTSPNGMRRIVRSDRIHESTNSVRFVRFLRDYPVQPLASTWTDTITGQYSDPRLYVVQTATKVVHRCILMTTDPWGSCVGSHLRLRHDRLCCRAVGAALDLHRHLASGPGSGALPGHGGALSILPACGQRGGEREGSRSYADCAVRQPDGRKHPAGLRV